jgi:hypothetical protein
VGIRYADNTNAPNGAPLTANASDPKHGTDTNVNQTYQEKGTTTFTNSSTISIGQDGVWDFGLVAYHAIQNTGYCFRIVNSDNSGLNTYTVYPELTIPAASITQASYRWYNPEPSGTTVTFAKAWGGTSSDYGNSLIQTSDGGYAVTGLTYSYGSGERDMFLAKYDSTGTLSWSKTWGGTGYDGGNSLIQTSDGGYAVTGQTVSYAVGGTDMFLAKYDSTGNLSWSKTWGGTGTDIGYSLVQTSDGGYAVTGETGFGDSSNGNIFIAKYDSTGNLSWNKTWGPTASLDTGRSIVQTSDGGYAVTGSTNGSILIAKYDASGNLSWNKTWGGTGTDQGNSLVQTSDGGYAVTGYTQSYGAGNYDMFIVKYDASGNLSWNKTWGGTSTEYSQSLVQTSDGGYAVAGYTLSYGAGGYDMLLVKYDASGNIGGCSSSMCQSPTATTSSPTATTSSPTATTTVIVAIAASIGNPFAPLNQPLDLPTLTPLALRLDVAVDNSGIATSGQALKLQYSPIGGSTSCSAVSTTSFSDVTTSGAVQYYDDSNHASGDGLFTNVTDPSDGSRTIVPQTYQESNNFTNSVEPIYAGQDGMWQFSLLINSATMRGKDFCLRVTLASDTYPTLTAANIPEIAYAPQMVQLMHGGNWFNRQGIRQNIIL